MSEDQKPAPPKPMKLVAPVRVDCLLNEHHGRQVLHLMTPWGWVYVRDDCQPFKALADLLPTIKPAPPVANPPELAPDGA